MYTVVVLYQGDDYWLFVMLRTWAIRMCVKRVAFVYTRFCLLHVAKMGVEYFEQYLLKRSNKRWKDYIKIHL
jgi:hypothetical protein